MIEPLPDMMIEPVVRAALAEDLGRAGDITSQAIIPAEQQWKGVLRARKAGVIAGMDLARLAFQIMGPSVAFDKKIQDGAQVEAESVLAFVSGNARAMMAAERVALNFLSHMSGIATLTRRYVDAAAPHKARICCTRKTTPTLRFIEKYAVRAGGGSNHRMGLDDAVMIKDNHIAIAGDIAKAVALARASIGHMVKIEVEVDTLEQLRSVLTLPVEVVLLDNMAPDLLAQAVKMVDGRFVTEASGSVTLEKVQAVAASGVDFISVGAITNSAPVLDIGLDSGV